MEEKRKGEKTGEGKRKQLRTSEGLKRGEMEKGRRGGWMDGEGEEGEEETVLRQSEKCIQEGKRRRIERRGEGSGGKEGKGRDKRIKAKLMWKRGET